VIGATVASHGVPVTPLRISDNTKNDAT